MTMTMPPMNAGSPMVKEHGAPVIASPTLDTDGLYRCDVVFQMASYDRERTTWVVERDRGRHSRGLGNGDRRLPRVDGD
jgi:hypothetical protein